MRWGVRDEATDDHMTTELCMREIENCQRLSMGPNFVVCYIVIVIALFYHLKASICMENIYLLCRYFSDKNMDIVLFRRTFLALN